MRIILSTLKSLFNPLTYRSKMYCVTLRKNPQIPADQNYIDRNQFRDAVMSWAAREGLEKEILRMPIAYDSLDGAPRIMLVCPPKTMEKIKAAFSKDIISIAPQNGEMVNYKNAPPSPQPPKDQR